jgi:hypothetical protein
MNQPEEIEQLREYAYVVLVPGSGSWAGSYGGVEGRITGGIITARTSARALAEIHFLHDQSVQRQDEHGWGVFDNGVPVMEIIPCVLRSLEPRTILLEPN